MTSKLTRRTFLHTLALTTGAAALAACGQSATPTTAPTEATSASAAAPADEATTAPASGAERTFQFNMPAFLGDPGAGVDPGTSGSSASTMINALMFASLVYFDENLQPQPLAAESWETTDGQVWTFKLRKDMKFTDGTPITAKDFEWSIKRNMSPDLKGGVYFILEFIKNAKAYYEKTITDANELGVKALDDYTLQFELEQPAAYFINVVSYPTYSALPRTAIEKYGDTDWTKPENIVTNGPYKLIEWIPDQQMVFTPNETYFGEKPKVDKLVLKMLKQEQATMAAYETDELDFVEVPVADISRVKEDGNLKDQFISKASQTVQYVIVRSQTVEPFDDPRVRQAFAMAIDRETLCNTILQGAYLPAYQFLMPGLVGYDPEIGQELAYNPEKARELLAEAGYPEGKDLPTVYWNSNQTDTYQTVFESLQAMVKENLGIDTELALMEASARGEWVNQKPAKPHLFRQGWGNDYPDPHSGMSFLKTPAPQAAVWTDSPDYVWTNKKYDELVDQGALETDPAKRAEIYKQAQQILIVEDPNIIPLYYVANNYLMKPWVKGVILNGLGFDLRFLSIEK